MSQRPAGERLTPADASNVVMDARDQVNVFLMAGTLGVGGFVGEDGGVDLDALRSDLSARLAGVAPDLARFSQRVVEDRRGLRWQPCRPDLTRHVREVAAVDGRAGLAAACATLMTQPLPLGRPLWELLVVPGAGAEGPGIVLRVHHALADGVGGVRLVQRLFGEEVVGQPERPRPTPTPPAGGAPSRPGSCA